MYLAVDVQVQTTINNLIVGKIYIQHTGTYTVRNHSTGLTAVMELVKPKLLTFSLKTRRQSQNLVRTSLVSQWPHQCSNTACNVLVLPMLPV